jgi:hypothetical protein
VFVADLSRDRFCAPAAAQLSASSLLLTNHFLITRTERSRKGEISYFFFVLEEEADEEEEELLEEVSILASSFASSSSTMAAEKENRGERHAKKSSSKAKGDVHASSRSGVGIQNDNSLLAEATYRKKNDKIDERDQSSKRGQKKEERTIIFTGFH